MYTVDTPISFRAKSTPSCNEGSVQSGVSNKLFQIEAKKGNMVRNKAFQIEVESARDNYKTRIRDCREQAKNCIPSQLRCSHR